MTGYAWHKRWPDIPTCEPCKAAKAQRNRDDVAAKKQREREAAPRLEAWRRACGRLAERYPAEFREILAHEMRGLVPPPGDEQGDDDGD